MADPDVAPALQVLECEPRYGIGVVEFLSAFAGGPLRLEAGKHAVNFVAGDAVGAFIRATVRRILDTAPRNGEGCTA
jgi:hypothetical protein